MGDSMINIDLLEPVGDVGDSVKKLTEAFAPIYTEYWNTRLSSKYGDPTFSINVNSLVNLWLSKAVKIFIGYENMRPAGFITGIEFRPLTHQSKIFRVEDWYAKSSEVLNEMFLYLRQGMRFMGVDAIEIMVDKDAPLPSALVSEWKEVSRSDFVRLAKS